MKTIIRAILTAIFLPCLSADNHVGMCRKSERNVILNFDQFVCVSVLLQRWNLILFMKENVKEHPLDIIQSRMKK